MCPIYEFDCQECEVCFELLCPIACGKVVECPECHNKTAHKIVSGGQAIDWGGNPPT